MPTGIAIKFKAMLTSFEDNFNSEWSTESVYGRMDNIYTFKQTNRSMNVGFVVPAFDAEDARSNLVNINRLSKFLYPTYVGEGSRANNVSNISQAPLLRIKFANIIQNSAGTNELGLLGKINGFTFAPVLDDGFFDYPGFLYPKTINVNFTFDVLHEHTVGWTDSPENNTANNLEFGAGIGKEFPNTQHLDSIPSNTIPLAEALDSADVGNDGDLRPGDIVSQNFLESFNRSPDDAADQDNVLGD